MISGSVTTTAVTVTTAAITFTPFLHKIVAENGQIVPGSYFVASDCTFRGLLTHTSQILKFT